MRTDTLNPRDLFEKPIRYIIPSFQRPYVWTQDEQWEPLWDDVRNTAETYLEEIESSSGNNYEAEQNTSSHFLGAIVTQQVPSAIRDIERREVVDGQQRITTLQLLIDAIQYICEEYEIRSLSKRLSKFVANTISF